MSSSKSVLPIVTANAAGGCCGSVNVGSCGCASPKTSVASFGASGSARYWRSLDEFRSNPEFAESFLHREFPVAASEYPEGVSRRRWMSLMGASLALVGAAGCRYSEEEILPFVIRPEGRVPGESYLRATNFELAGRVYNLLISCVDGRPLKVEPNPSHPSDVGTDVYSQASILSLYDPDRAGGNPDKLILKKVDKKREFSSWEKFASFGEILLNSAAKKDGGAKFAVLMSPTSSPSTVRMLKLLREKLPKATLCRYDSVEGDVVEVATKAMFGKPCRQSLALENAKVIVAIQADILGNDRNMVRSAAGFAKGRSNPAASMNQLFVVEATYTNTGASADARLAIRPSQMPALIAELGRRVESLKSGAHDHKADEKSYDECDSAERLERFIDEAAHAIVDAGDSAVVVVGESLGVDAFSAAVAMNAKIGSLGKIQRFLPTVDGDLGVTVSIDKLAASMKAGEFDSVLILGDNPVFTAPSDLDLGAAIGAVANSIYLGQYDDETGVLCSWSLPQAHPLESWGDCVDIDGNYGVCQPQILPLLGGRTTAEVLAAILNADRLNGETIVRQAADSMSGSLSDRQWRALLHDGYSANLKVGFVTDAPELGGKAIDAKPDPSTDISADKIELVFVPADGIYDGQFANNGWLQELPQSLTKMAWDNAAVMSPRTARQLGAGVKHGTMLALQKDGAKIELPVYEMPGVAPGVVYTQIGYGRTRAGQVGGHTDSDAPVVGFDVSPLRRSGQMQIVYGVQAQSVGKAYEISATQDHWAIDELGRNESIARSFDLIREGSLELLKKAPQFAEAKSPHVPKVGANGSPWREPIDQIQDENRPDNPEGKPRVPQWGMAIDLTKCTGCNACVVACQSENNVPIVGREQVINSREMHWLRVDRYFQGDEDNADIVTQPLACMHCETAPCEQVCPVAATVHTDEGINAMAYNRCIGTRYCANNCPFKVRRFNYFNYNVPVGVGYGWDAFPDTIEKAPRKLQAFVLNPEVTVRGRGVMEKCTYCTQRVEKAKIDARRENRGQVRDGDIVTACQSACPTKAIEFGDISQPDSKVSKMHADVRSYGMLSQLNVKARTEYLARVRNTPKRLMTRSQLNDLANSKLEPVGHGAHGHGDHGHGDHDSHDDHGHSGDHSSHDYSQKKEAAH
jgi:MoCo/4Fe-4S cofactor protein with predicted Tat translocation signal